VRVTKTISDPVLAGYLGKKTLIKGKPIFDTSDTQVREYFKGIAGNDFKVKDFRTWHGTGKALSMVKKMPTPKTATAFKKSRSQVAKAVSNHLGNTPAVALSAYIAPEVFKRPGWDSWYESVVKKADELEDFRELLDDFFSSVTYDDTDTKWQDVPETEFDPDDSDADEEIEAQIKKAETVVLKPFVSFRDDVSTGTSKMLQLVSSLHTSRLSAFGFTVEAEVLGIEKYAINEQLDSRICPVCREMHGKTFPVRDAVSALGEIFSVEEPDDMAVVQSWPKQDRNSVEALRKMSAEDLIENNWHLPPYHPGCRGLLVPVGKVPSIQDTPSYRAATARNLAQIMSDPALASLTLTEVEGIRSALAGTSGVVAGKEWTRLKAIYAVEILEAATGVLDDFVTSGSADFT